MNKLSRQQIVACISAMFPQVSEITPGDRSLFQAYKDGGTGPNTYGNSYFYLCQAANGIGADKLGLKYDDGQMLVTIGVFERASYGGGWHTHLIRPLGKFDVDTLIELALYARDFSENPVFVKKLSRDECDALIAKGFSPVSDYPWHVQAAAEDDTYPEVILDTSDVVERAETATRGELRDKFRRFARKHGEHCTTVPLKGERQEDAESLVAQFFRHLEIKNLHISAPSDYDNIIAHHPCGENGRDFICDLVYVRGKPAALVAIEPTSKTQAGLYANITMHWDVPYLSEWVIVEYCRRLRDLGYTELNLGGSETEGLHTFKSKFVPKREVEMGWVVLR